MFLARKAPDAKNPGLLASAQRTAPSALKVVFETRDHNIREPLVVVFHMPIVGKIGHDD
jgi:hypothetical protein